jgi:hypothetical protein
MRKSAIEYLDRPPPGWFVLDVMKRQSWKWDWCALLIDVDPDTDKFKHCYNCKTAWLRIPGKHRNRDAAWDALEALLATRH